MHSPEGMQEHRGGCNLPNSDVINFVTIRFKSKTAISKRIFVNCKSIEQSWNKIELRDSLIDFDCLPIESFYSKRIKHRLWVSYLLFHSSVLH